MENTQENRIALIREAYLNSKAIAPKQSVGDENQYLHSDSAEEIDEEDQDFGLSDEMKGVYK